MRGAGLEWHGELPVACRPCGRSQARRRRVCGTARPPAARQKKVVTWRAAASSTRPRPTRGPPWSSRHRLLRRLGRHSCRRGQNDFGRIGAQRPGPQPRRARARTPRCQWELGTGERPRPRKSGTGSGERPRFWQNRGRSVPVPANRGLGRGRGPVPVPFFLESTFKDQINPKRQTAGPHEGGSPELDLEFQSPSESADKWGIRTGTVTGTGTVGPGWPRPDPAAESKRKDQRA